VVISSLYVLDDLKGIIDVGGFGEGFHEGIVPFHAIENPGNPDLNSLD